MVKSEMKITRRQFLKAGAVAGAGIGLGVWKPWEGLAIQSPSYDDIPVAVVKDPLAVSYPADTNIPFNPPEIYPEYPYTSSNVNVTNRVYPMVREALRLLNPDGFGTSSWNPLGNLIDAQHKRILIKPNFVQNIWTDYTHASVLRPIIDYAYLALRQAGVSGTIIVGDGADTPEGFWPIANKHGLSATVGILTGWGVPIEAKDLNDDSFQEINIFSTGACEFSSDSVNPPPPEAEWTGPNQDELSPGVYTFTRTPIDVDVIINVPKMKGHGLAGVSLCLKNLLGLLKPGQKGPYKDCPHRSDYDKKWNPKKNDSIWRSILDINKIALYYRDGLQSTRQRHYLSIIDGIIGMQGRSPHYGTPKVSSTIIAGYDPVSVDAVATRVMGLNWSQIPQILYGDQIQGMPLGPTEAGMIEVRMPEGRSISGDYPAATAYVLQGWHGQDISYLHLSDFTPPTVTASHEDRTVLATVNITGVNKNIAEDDITEIKKVDLCCKRVSGEITKVPMEQISGGSKKGVFKATMPRHTVEYYVKAVDTFFNDAYTSIQTVSLKPGACERRKRGSYYE